MTKNSESDMFESGANGKMTANASAMTSFGILPLRRDIFRNSEQHKNAITAMRIAVGHVPRNRHATVPIA